MKKPNSLNTISEIVNNLRGIAKNIKSTKIDGITIPLTGSFKENHPLGIKPGVYKKEELAKAIQFIGDMLEQ